FRQRGSLYFFSSYEIPYSYFVSSIILQKNKTLIPGGIRVFAAHALLCGRLRSLRRFRCLIFCLWLLDFTERFLQISPCGRDTRFEFIQRGFHRRLPGCNQSQDLILYLIVLLTL